ncbi:hypothetical protein [Piscinibacterium candidicorallinum]|jgi:Zn ribbon nucleic-acid-binding protein|uniref:MJ0042 family finger-like domain-containing protein n=1 Tax=Piscinibacterium candidicorallinum TaxID=1793872 RepID=A0ABV7H4A2_9BURK
MDTRTPDPQPHPAAHQVSRFAQSLKARGFRSWYERQLIISHGFMVTGLLCVVALAAWIEESRQHAALSDQLIGFAFAALGGWFGLQCLREYRRSLITAEFVSGQASCPTCETYGRLTVLEAEGEHAVRVRCKHCAHEWRIEDTPQPANTAD